MKLHVVCDLDCTLINAVELDDLALIPKDAPFEGHVMEGYYKIFARPHLQQFLDFVFENYDVSVFTAAEKDYALFILDNFILTKPERKLKKFLHRTATQFSDYYYDNPKDLSLFDDPNVVIIDDLADVFYANPYRTIVATRFELLNYYSGNMLKVTPEIALLEEYPEDSPELVYHGELEHDAFLLQAILALKNFSF